MSVETADNVEELEGAEINQVEADAAPAEPSQVIESPPAEAAAEAAPAQIAAITSTTSRSYVLKSTTTAELNDLRTYAEEVERCEDELEQRDSVIAGLKEEMKEAKIDREAAVLALRRAANRRRLAERNRLEAVQRAKTAADRAERAEREAKERHAREAAEKPLLADQIADESPPAAESWRVVPIDDLGLSPNLTEKLREAGIETMGQLEDQRGCRGPVAGPKGLREVPGIGQGKADAIEEAMLKWLDVHRGDAAVIASQGSSGVGEPSAARVLPDDGPEDDAPGDEEEDDDDDSWVEDDDEDDSDDSEIDEIGASAEEAETDWPADPAANSRAELGDEEWKDEVVARADQLEIIGIVDESRSPDAEICAKGRAAQEEGEKLEDCIYRPGPERDSWLIGFMAAEGEGNE